MNVKCHVSDFMLIDRDLHSLLQNISEHGCCLKFIMKKYSDIICQWIADLLLIPDSRNSKGDMICQRDHDPAVYFPKNFFCFPDHLICDFQKFRIHLVILCIDCDHAIIIQNFAYSVHIWFPRRRVLSSDFILAENEGKVKKRLRKRERKFGCFLTGVK